MQTYQNKRKAPERASSPAQKTAPTRSEMLHLAGAGAPQPMSPQLREKFEPGFCADFTNIRISRGHIPEEMGVQAVAQGTDILLDESAGMDVLGHELAHVVQQAQGRVGGGFPVVENAALEHEADVMGQRVSSGLTAQAGPQNGWGGEPMAISPMSESAAPAQCKIGRNKKNKDAAPGPQQGTGGAVQAAKVSTHSLSDEEERALQEGMLHAPGIWDSGSEGDFDDLHDSLEADDKTDEIAHYIVPTDEEMDGLSAPAPKKHWWQRRR